VTELQLTQPPVANAAMLIRRPVADVFEAFVDPAITTRFWFTKGSGKLETGKQVQWDWEMYNVSVQVDVIALEQDQRIQIEWGSGGEPTTTVEWLFTALPDGTTFVNVTGDEVVSQALDSTGGFTWVLAGLKAWLEHGIELNLVRDRFPATLEQH
jgi:uncharacterized protein YndB with AHSA1/START domain